MKEDENSETRNLLITGATGMIGSALSKSLIGAGYTVYSLDRHSGSSPFRYDEKSKRVTLDSNIPLFAVINLAGPSLADKRWSEARKEKLMSSRIDLTKALALALAKLASKPTLFLSASAIGYYGLTQDNIVDEESPAGTDFLAQIGQQWEAATRPAEEVGINTIHLRLGVVLSKGGGMLQRQLLPFKLGLGGRLGNGRQYLSWISLSDVQQVILYLLRDASITGPINLVAEAAVTNAEFTAQLGNALRRPSFLPLPAGIIKFVFGEMGECLLLGSSRVHSKRLKALGIKLQHPDLRSALSAELKK